jgi:hypothetical protein
VNCKIHASTPAEGRCTSCAEPLCGHCLGEMDRQRCCPSCGPPAAGGALNVDVARTDATRQRPRLGRVGRAAIASCAFFWLWGATALVWYLFGIEHVSTPDAVHSLRWTDHGTTWFVKPGDVRVFHFLLVGGAIGFLVSFLPFAYAVRPSGPYRRGL